MTRKIGLPLAAAFAFTLMVGCEGANPPAKAPPASSVTPPGPPGKRAPEGGGPQNKAAPAQEDKL